MMICGRSVSAGATVLLAALPGAWRRQALRNSSGVSSRLLEHDDVESGQAAAMALCSTRARSRSGLALPYPIRLINFTRVFWPSVWPLLHGDVNAADTAA